MARKFLTSIDLNLSELQNAVIQNLAANPTTGNTDGRIYYNTVADEMRVYANGAWQAIGSGDINSVVGTADEVTVSVVDGVATISLPSTINADTTGNAATATKLATTRAIELSGDVTGTANFDGSAAINITATIAANSVALGTDTTGDYVASVSASDGISATGTGEGATVALTNSDKGSSQNIFKNVAVAGQSTIVADTNNDTLTVVGGTGITLTTNDTTDTLTVANAGVTGVAGTANQITASGSTGSVTLSLPSAVTFPGSVTLNADPSSALQAATKQYVDSIAQGLDLKASVKVATTVNGTLSTAFADGSTVDGVTLVTGDRILIKNQTDATKNGIYTVNASGAPTRSTDMDADSEFPGAFTFVEQGTVNNDRGFVCTNNSVVVGTTEIAFTQFSSAGSYTAGNGITLTGTAFSIDTSITADLSTAQTFTNKTLTSPTISGAVFSDGSIVFEGATADAHETTLTVVDPTADRTITFKDASGTVAFTSDIPSNTDSLTEGSTNLYFTNERAQDAVGNNLSGSNSLAATYNDGAGTFVFDTTLASTSYMSKSSGLAVDASALGTKLVTDGFTKKYSVSVGDASATSIAVTHNLNSRDVQVQIYDNTTYDTVEADVVRTDANTVTVLFSTAPTSNAYRVVVIG
jgi:hypothetical protein